MRILLLLIVNITISRDVTVVMGDGKQVPQTGLQSQHNWRYSSFSRLLRLKSIALNVMTQILGHRFSEIEPLGSSADRRRTRLQTYKKHHNPSLSHLGLDGQ